MSTSRAVGNGLMALGALMTVGALTVGLVNQAATPSPSPTATPAPASTPAPTAPDPSSTPSAIAAPALAWGPTVQEYDDALAEAAALTLDQVIGQVIIAPVSDPDPKAAARLVKRHHLAGVIVMGPAVKSAKKTAKLTAAVQDAHRAPWPALVGADEEGGAVARLKPVLPDMPAFMAAGAIDDAEATSSVWTSHGAAMARLGITMDFAPPADVTVGPADPIIRTRSASSNPRRAARAVVAAMDGLTAGGLVAVPKHFPGHGSIRTDSHQKVSVQRRSLAQLERTDLIPFASAIEAGAPAIMMGHIVVKDWGKRPASVNRRAYKYLRDDLGFDGVTITDALNMKGVTSVFKRDTAAAEALIAGADIVLLPANTAKSVKQIKQAVKRGDLTRDRLNDAAAKSILLARWQAALAHGAPKSAYARTYSAQAAVVAARNCTSLVGKSVTITGGTKYQRTHLARSLSDAGVRVKSKGGATSVALVTGDRAAAKADVVVALGGPWGLERSKAKVYVATWGGGPDQMRALGDVLAGKTQARGTWPVKIKVPYAPCASDR